MKTEIEPGSNLGRVAALVLLACGMLAPLCARAQADPMTPSQIFRLDTVLSENFGPHAGDWTVSSAARSRAEHAAVPRPTASRDAEVAASSGRPLVHIVDGSNEFDGHSTGATLTFTNGTDRSVIPIPGPGSASVSVSGSRRNPTFSWAYSGGSAHGVGLQVVDPSRQHEGDANGLTVLNEMIPGPSNSFKIPDTLDDGTTLAFGHHYVVELEGVVDGNALSTSAFDFVPLPAASVPSVAIGYNPAVGADEPSFTSIVVPDGDVFLDVPLCGRADFEAGSTLTAALGLDCVVLPGIETAAGADATGTAAVVSGLSPTSNDAFTTEGPVAVDASVPEPASLGLVGVGLVYLMRRNRRRAVPLPD